MDAWASTSAKQADIISVSHNGQMQQPNQAGIRRKTGCFFSCGKGENSTFSNIYGSPNVRQKSGKLVAQSIDTHGVV